ncbi:acyl--CoA ligase [Sporobolomyces salmoneus]|uniref:acyl--CoA ligase n=1 Tax=Sporobolomyces salmoneus TaxID=183962 RepID=UPI0031794FBE
MPYDPSTGIHTSPLPPVQLPQEPLSLYDFLFPDGEVQDDTRPAIIDSTSDRQYTRKQARGRVLNLAKAFHARGIRDKTCAVVFSPNDIDYGPCLWATFRQGGIVSPANPSYNASELAYQITTVDKHYPVKLLLCHPDSIVDAVKACEQVGLDSRIIVLIHAGGSNNELARGFPTLDDVVAESKNNNLPPQITLSKEEAKTKLAFLSFSSGTTGLPKAVEIPHYAVISNVLQSSSHWAQTFPFKSYDAQKKEGDVVLGVLPFYHIYGLVVILHGSIYQNLPLVILPRFTLPGFLDAISRFRISILFVVPPMIIVLVKNDTSKYDLSSVRLTMSGAAPLTEETVDAFRKKFPHSMCGQGYGTTESSTIITLLDAGQSNFPASSSGVLVPNIEARIVSPEGKFLGPNEIGELWSRGPSNALGYLGNEKATKETFDDERFLHTGDECRIDENGLVFVVDRIKELIKSSGFQVPPAELEGHLLAHPDVQDVAVIGILDERRGEAPKAYVVPSVAWSSNKSNDEARLIEALKKFVTDHKVKYKALSEVEIIDAIPKTASGKLLRKDLRVRHAQTVKARNAKL